MSEASMRGVKRFRKVMELWSSSVKDPLSYPGYQEEVAKIFDEEFAPGIEELEQRLSLEVSRVAVGLKREHDLRYDNSRLEYEVMDLRNELSDILTFAIRKQFHLIAEKAGEAISKKRLGIPLEEE